MKITDVQAHVLAIPMAPGKQKMPWTWGNFNQVLISVHTDAGLTGYGEAFGYGVPQATASVVDEILKPMLVGADATQITTLQDRMFRNTHLFGRYGVTNFGISGVDIALWDLAGKSAGLPLYKLFGGAAATEVPAYASLVRYSAPEHVSEAVAQARDEGYDAIKLHQIDVESVHVAREAAGEDILLMLDVNCSWARTRRWTSLCSAFPTTCIGWRNPSGHPRISKPWPTSNRPARHRSPPAKTPARYTSFNT